MMATQMQVDGDFSSSITTDANANASFTNPVKASQLAKGDFILTKNHPCKITAKTTSKPGKHGHANVSFEATSLLTSKKYTDLHPAHATVSVPIVTFKSYLLLDLNEGFLSLWDQHTGQIKDDVRTRTEGGVSAKLAALWEKEIERDVWVTVLATMGKEVVEAVKEGEAGQ